MKKAFTLIELLVVIAIIGILAGITLSSFKGGTESARAAKCIANMRDLAQAAITYATSGNAKDSSMPHAGAYVSMNKIDATYSGHKGWINWLDTEGYYKYTSNESKPDLRQFPNINACCESEDDSTFAITNGALWKYVGQNRNAYVCPEHARLAEKYKAKVRFSYAMNAYFGYDKKPGSAIEGKWRNLRGINADRVLLFAEVPFGVAGSKYDTANHTSKPGEAAYVSGQGDTQLDCVLQCSAEIDGKKYNKSWEGPAEAIAFNHKNGNKGWCAHVAFADGHIEKLTLPSKDSGALDALSLTALLCGGVAVNFDGSGYSMPEDADNQYGTSGDEF